jgi:MFS transporter, DHA2 family, multidrug resistance protein
MERGWSKWAIAITAALGALLEVVDTSIVNVALTDMQASLGATLSEVGWVVTSYAIANVIIIPLTAWLGDYFGKKPYFVFSLVAFTAASVLCGMATSLWMLIVARVLQGLGGGGLLAKAQAILFETFPREEQGKAQAIFGVTVIAGPALGPTLGGWITTNMSWRWIFFINLPIGIAATFMAIAFLPKGGEKKVSKKVDWLGIALLVVGIGSLQTVLEEGQGEDWFDSRIITMFALLAAAGLCTFVWRQLTIDHPVVDLRVLRHRTLAAGSVFSSVLGMGLYGAIFAVPIFAQSMLGYTAQETGMLLLPGALASAVMMPIAGRLSGRFDSRMLIFVGGLVLVTTMLMLSHLNAQTGANDLQLPMIIRGVGTTLMFLPLSLATFGTLPKAEIAAASGFFNLMRQLGGSVGIAALTTILARRQAFHRAVLIEKVSDASRAAQDRIASLTGYFMSRGSDLLTARQKAMAMMDGAVSRQAAILSFADTFYFVAIVVIAATPLLFMLGSGRGAKPAADAH